MAMVESLESKKARADEANVLVGQLDEVTQKAIYIATHMFLAAKNTEKHESKQTETV